MTATILGWLVTAYADHGELILAAGIAAAAGWASHLLTARTIRRAAAIDAEQAARPAGDELEQLWTLPEIADTHRNTRKENRP